MQRSDRAWHQLGARNPYFGVLTHQQFRGPQLESAARGRFFQSGEDHVRRTLETVQRHLGPVNYQAPCLDFGCGVGRLVLPLAHRFERVVGVDVSPGMLREARRNCRDQGVHNAAFVLSDAARGLGPGHFGFVHSYIVFQHIPERRGRRIFGKLLDLLRPGGLAAIHVAYAREASRLRRMIRPLRRFGPINGVANLMLGRRWTEPFIGMHTYDLNRLVLAIQRRGVEELYCRLTASRDSGGFRGLSFFFRKPAAAVAALASSAMMMALAPALAG